MKQPGLDGRHRDEDGKIREKRSDALNGNLPKPIEGFRSDATVRHMREVTGKESLEDIARAAKRMRK